MIVDKNIAADPTGLADAFLLARDVGQEAG